MLYDLESARLARKPLADTESAARALLAMQPRQPMSGDLGGDSLAENFRPQPAEAATHYCDHQVAQDRRAKTRTDDIGDGFRIALFVVGAIASMAGVVGLLTLTLNTPIDKPAAAKGAK